MSSRPPLRSIWKLPVGVLAFVEFGFAEQWDIPDYSAGKIRGCGCWQHGLEEKAGDVGEKGAVVPGDAFLGDESEEFGHDAAEFFASAEFRTAGEEFVGDGLEFGIVLFFEQMIVDQAKSGVAAAERIQAATAMSGSVSAAIFEWNLAPSAG